MNKQTPEQLAKLPKWAQEHIQCTENLRERAEKRLADYTNRTPTRVVVGSYSDAPLYLPDRETISFSMGVSLRYIEANLTDRSRVTIRGSGPITIKPVASNTVEVYLAD